jgi:hypothetical protein
MPGLTDNRRLTKPVRSRGGYFEGEGASEDVAVGEADGQAGG